MNQTYTIKNFRVFDEQGATFEMAPLTILTGCNSSGKSSVTKSLVLLNDMFARILQDYQAGAPCYLEDYTLRFNSGSHKLGKFETIVHDKSSNKSSFSIEYTGHSCFTNANLTVQITFACDKSKEDGSGRMAKIIILDEGKNQICEMDFNTGTMTCDFSIIKDKFFTFAHYASLYNQYRPIYEKLCNQEELTEKEIKDGKNLEEQLGDAFRHIFINVIPTIYTRDHLHELVKVYDLDNLEYKSLFYVDALKWLAGYKKVDVRRVIENHVKRSIIEKLPYKEQVPIVKEKIKLIIDEFYRSGFKSFIEFYLYYEDLFLKKSKMEFMHKESDSVTTSSFISIIENSLGYKYDAFNSYLTFIKDSTVTYVNDVEMLWEKEETRFIFILHYMRMIFSSYADYNKVYNYDGYNSWYSTPIFDAMILFLCNIVEDALVAAPAFINNMDFVDAHRAHVQRLYNVQDTSSFNTLIQKYLAEKVEYPERELFEVYNSMIPKAQNLTVKEIAPNGQPIFDKPVELAIANYAIKQNRDYSRRYKKGTFIIEWLKQFAIADDIKFPLSAEGAGVSVKLVKDGVERNLADFGFGVTQLVAILMQIEVNILKNQKEDGEERVVDKDVEKLVVKCIKREVDSKSELGEKVATFLNNPQNLPKDLRVELLKNANEEDIDASIRTIYKINYIFEPSYLALEEPETHLHPKYQSMLADMFYDAYTNYNIHFIIETHSEYLVRKTQVLVAQKAQEEGWNEQDLAEKCPFKVYYMPRPEEGKPYDMHYQTNGTFVEQFGAGFYDEASALSFQVLIADGE